MGSAQDRRGEVAALLARDPELWWGHHAEHGWVVLDRRDPRNAGDTRHLLRQRGMSAIEVPLSEYGSARYDWFKNRLAKLPDEKATAACDELLAFRSAFTEMPRLTLIRISGRAQVSRRSRPVTDEAILRRIDGASSDSLCSEFLDTDLADLGISGGAVRLVRVAGTGDFRVVTEYESLSWLDVATLRRLTEFTQAQWSDGIGEGCFDRLSERMGVVIDPSPFLQEKDLRVEMFRTMSAAPVANLGFDRAVRTGDLARVRAMLDAGADVNARQQGRPALIKAILNGHAEVALEMIARGADVHASDNCGWDPLLVCATSPQLGDDDAARVARALAQGGADVSRARGVLSEALEKGKGRLAALLRELGARE